MKLSELSVKDVIRDEDGTKLGKIEDITIDTATGRVISLHVNNGFKIRGLFTSTDVIDIPWNKIVKIGSDVIIVETVQKINMEIKNNT